LSVSIKPDKQAIHFRCMNLSEWSPKTHLVKIHSRLSSTKQ